MAAAPWRLRPEAPEIYFLPEKIIRVVKKTSSYCSKIKRQIFFGFLCLLPTCLYAGTFQQQVVNTAEHFLKNKAAQAMIDMRASRTGVMVMPPSGSLTLPICPVTPQVEDISRDAIGDQRLKIQCSAGKSWSVFVRGEIAVYRSVLVANRPLDRGVPIPATAVSLQSENLAELEKGYLTHTSELDYRITRTRIKVGTPLQPDMLEADTLISRGDRIAITAGSGGVKVSVDGEALESGALHEQIRVRNSVSDRIIHAIVSGRGQVVVN